MNSSTQNLKNMVEELLASMPEIDYQEENNIIRLCKDKAIFGKIEKDKIFLLSTSGRFIEITQSTLEDKDAFLKTATLAYWFASGQIQTDTDVLRLID